MKTIDPLTSDGSEDLFAKERRLRRLAAKRGYALVKPWRHDRRKVDGNNEGYVLVPHQRE
jgi:hypothetical protein